MYNAEKILPLFVLPLVFLFPQRSLVAQDTLRSHNKDSLYVKPGDADPGYITKFKRKNVARVFYGAGDFGLIWGSTNLQNGTTHLKFTSNGSDFIGVGLGYKFIDFDLSFSLPNTSVIATEREQVTQFQFAMSFTSRMYTTRAYIMSYRGMIAVSDNNSFQSAPDIHYARYGAQFTYFLNGEKYSFRAASFQYELQKKTAGSFFLRAEPFYRTVTPGDKFVPDSLDKVAVYGLQTKIDYIRAPGIYCLPGYGINFVRGGGRWYFAPMIFAGPGLAFNSYKGSGGAYNATRVEWSGLASVNTGFSNARLYADLYAYVDANYSPLNPSYLLAGRYKIVFSFGWRFVNLEHFLPENLFKW